MQRRKRRKTKQLYIKLLFLIIVILVAVNLIKNTNAKYKSSGAGDAEVDLAFYVFKEGAISQNLKIASILPRSQSYTYTFSVANNYQGERTQTALEYTIAMKTTTNLQLLYSVHKQGENTELITSTTTSADDDGTFFKYFTIQGDEFGFSQDQQIIYEIEVTFQTQFNQAQYEGIIEYVELTIDSRQKIS